MSINRLFDVNLKAADGWTQGEDWADCNPVQDINGIYHRIYNDSDGENPNYRIERGDNFYIGAHPSQIRDWVPRTAPWNFDIDEATEGAWFSFYFGLQVGEAFANSGAIVAIPVLLLSFQTPRPSDWETLNSHMSL